MIQSSAEKRAFWNNLIEEQSKTSLSIKQWCREKGVNFRHFYYWKAVFYPKLTKESFSMIPSVKEELLLTYMGVTIQVDGNVSQPLLKKCLTAIRRSLC